MKFGFIAKHGGIWPADWMCGALGVSRGGFYSWLTRSRSKRSRGDEELGAKVRASFLASDRTYGARRVWHDQLAEGVNASRPTRAFTSCYARRGHPFRRVNAITLRGAWRRTSSCRSY